jgi:hypothetical protein
MGRCLWRSVQQLPCRCSGAARRFLLEMNPTPEDAAGISEVVGGATDDYLSRYIGLRLAP